MYRGYFNSSYVPSDAERLFIAQPTVNLGPNLICLCFAHLFQGIVIVQAMNYFSRWWSTDTVYTKTHMIALILLSLTHTIFLTAQEWLLFVPSFGDWEYLTRISAISRCVTLSATILSLCAELFFLIRVYKLPWRFDYLFLPLVVFFVGTLGTGVSQAVIMPSHLNGTAFPDTFHRLDVGSAVFPCFLNAGITIFMLAFLIHKTLPVSTKFPQTLISLALHSALPATIFVFLDLASAFQQPPYAFRTLTHSIVGYVQAICVLYSLQCRTHPSSLEAQTSDSGHKTAADLRWTSCVPLTGTAPRLSLLPLHRRAGSNSILSNQLERTNTEVARARRVSDADSGYSISFGPPGLNYNPASFKAIYEEPAEVNEM